MKMRKVKNRDVKITESERVLVGMWKKSVEERMRRSERWKRAPI